MTAPAATVAPPRGRLTDAQGLALVLLLTFAVALRPAVDNDLWWHLRSGQWMVRHHRLLGADPFSYTAAGHSRVPYDWLSQLGLYGTYRVGGLLALSLLTASLATLGMFLLSVACRPKTVVRLVVLVLVGMASAVFWSPRPQMATFVGTAAVVMVLALERRGSRALWWLVPVFALWSNLHLGWFYGLAVLWGTAIGWAVDGWTGRDRIEPGLVRRTVAVAAACSAAVFVHPAARRLPRLLLTQVTVGQRFITEDQPPNWHHSETWPFFILLVVVAAVLFTERRRVTITEVVLVAGTAVAAASAVRLVPLFATVAAAPLTRHGSAVVERLRGDAARRPVRRDPTFSRIAVGMTAVAALLVGLVRLNPSNVSATLHREAPVSATAWLLGTRPPGRLWSTFDWGGWFIWKAPRYPVWIDGRADLHEGELATYGRLQLADGWRTVFDRDGVNVAVVETNSTLERALAGSPAWKLAYRDQVATGFVRRQPVRVPVPGS